MGMHDLFDVDNQPACNDVFEPDPLAELKQSIDKLEQSVAECTAAVNEFIKGKL